MKTIKKAIALVLTALMVLSLVPSIGVSAQSDPGMTLAQFKGEIAPRLESFYANIASEQAVILRTMGDSIGNSALNPFVNNNPLNSAWDNIIDTNLLNPTLIGKYSSQAEAKLVLAKMIYSTLQLMFYIRNDNVNTDAQRLDSAINNAYDNLYLPMDRLAGTAFTQAALSSILSEVRNTLSSQLSTYANAITDAMTEANTTTYVNIIVNSIASVAITNLLNSATTGSTLGTLKDNFLSNAGLSATTLGDLVQKLYLATSAVDATQKAPAVQFNLLINHVIKFQDRHNSTPIYFDQAITLNSATGNEVNLKINPDRDVAGISLDMTSYFQVASPNNNIIATRVQDDLYGGYYIKLKAAPNVINNSTDYVKVYRHSVTGENYFFTIKVTVVGTGVNKADLSTAIANATTLLNSKTVGEANGNVSQIVKNNYDSAILIAKAVEENSEATEAQVNAAVSALATATTTFNSSIVVVSISALATAITNATTLINSKIVGVAVGNVPQSANTAYQLAITNAISIRDSVSTTQANVTLAISALADATVIFNAAIILPAPPNVELRRLVNGTQSESVQTFSTLAQATAYVKLREDAVKRNNTDLTVRYYAVPKDGVTPIANRNLSVSKILVSYELGADSIIPDGAVVWASTNPGTTPKIESTDYYTKGTNAFATIPQAVDAATPGAEVVIKDGNYSTPADFRIKKKLLIRNGSNPVITGDMILEAAFDGGTIQGITFGRGADGTLSTITVDSPNITIANLNLDNVALVVNASSVTIQNVTVVTAPIPPVGVTVVPAITLTAAADNTTISGFSFTETGAAAGAAITADVGVTGTAITDSVVTGSDAAVETNSTIIFADTSLANNNTQSSIYVEARAEVVNGFNTATELANGVVLKVRQVTSLDGTIKAVVYLTGIDADKNIDSGHVVMGYTLKTLETPLDAAIIGAVSANSSFQKVSTSTKYPGLLEVAFSRNGAQAGIPTNVDTDNDGTPDTLALDLFSVTFNIKAGASVGDLYSIWLSGTSPKTEIKRSEIRFVSGNSGPTQPVFGNMEIAVSPSYILKTVPTVTLAVRMQLPFSVKNNGSLALQGFKVEIKDMDTLTKETYNIYNGADADPYSTHAGATLVTLDKAGAVIDAANTSASVYEYVLTLPGYLVDKQYEISVIGEGYSTVTKSTNRLATDLTLIVWNNIRSTGANFLAGDVVDTSATDSEPVNHSDFVAIQPKYDVTSTNPLYDLKFDFNRDQKINLDDVEVLLLNMNNFKINYGSTNSGTLN